MNYLKYVLDNRASSLILLFSAVFWAFGVSGMECYDLYSDHARMEMVLTDLYSNGA